MIRIFLGIKCFRLLKNVKYSRKNNFTFLITGDLLLFRKKL